ncbi:hypothetical protein EYC84_005697 [Monilinia fructicola]|uniref:Uncharacterized protein n=1 Tax=Monilinia fructicola TaxID=38448 RepID=A0A5M9K090_MONFR|nr:hypothetical protein EYC84_005697 [Monilinia fructicola]
MHPPIHDQPVEIRGCTLRARAGRGDSDISRIHTTEEMDGWTGLDVTRGDAMRCCGVSFPPRHASPRSRMRAPREEKRRLLWAMCREDGVWDGDWHPTHPQRIQAQAPDHPKRLGLERRGSTVAPSRTHARTHARAHQLQYNTIQYKTKPHQARKAIGAEIPLPGRPASTSAGGEGGTWRMGDRWHCASSDHPSNDSVVDGWMDGSPSSSSSSSCHFRAGVARGVCTVAVMHACIMVRYEADA